MTRVFGRKQLEGLATFWRIYRRDGVTLGFATHDRDLWFDGILHRAAPGLVPSSIRKTANLSNDSADVEGALSHGSISASDLGAGRFDGAKVAIGIVDWETLDFAILYHGEAGAISMEDGKFSTELQSAKLALEADLVPRTSPTCRAEFCGEGCNLNPARFSAEREVDFVDHDAGLVRFSGTGDPTVFSDGILRWIDGPHAGMTMQIMRSDMNGQTLDHALDETLEPGCRAILKEGCDHTLATCQSRFSNAVNFRGEPFVPGNDLLSRYPTSNL